ncbi:unnamed protein product [Amoebophrya sp. A120]|nr:unnamed protein product [Amoebophrya sp. A120]|eukprot:GSA120T00003761001.1
MADAIMKAKVERCDLQTRVENFVVLHTQSSKTMKFWVQEMNETRSTPSDATPKNDDSHVGEINEEKTAAEEEGQNFLHAVVVDAAEPEPAQAMLPPGQGKKSKREIADEEFVLAHALERERDPLTGEIDFEDSEDGDADGFRFLRETDTWLDVVAAVFEHRRKNNEPMTDAIEIYCGFNAMPMPEENEKNAEGEKEHTPEESSQINEDYMDIDEP